MLKYVSYTTSFTEVPDEVSLVIQVTNCGHACPGCHSPYLQQDVGKNLADDMHYLMEQYKDRVTCVCFMGYGCDLQSLLEIVQYVKRYGKKVAVYSADGPDSPLLKRHCNESENLDYVKIGEYNVQSGGLESPETNQRMYAWSDERNQWVDIGYKFRKKYN